MLRCTVAGLIPVMMSEKYMSRCEDIYQNSKNHFDSIIKNESWYLLRYLPQDIAKKLGEAPLRDMLKKQRKTGLWKVKNAERITYDIYAALKHMGILQEALAGGIIKFDTLTLIENNYDFYSLLIKKNIFGRLSGKDREAIDSTIIEILTAQQSNGSWGDTVTETSVTLENLTELGQSAENGAVRRGCDYLFDQLNKEFPAHHVGKPYGFIAKNMFSGKDRGKEFAAAQNIKPEWISRTVCFHHVGVIQNSLALIVLLKLGFGKNEAVIHAVDNLYDTYSKYNGFCDSDIKKKYAAENGIKL